MAQFTTEVKPHISEKIINADGINNRHELI